MRAHLVRTKVFLSLGLVGAFAIVLGGCGGSTGQVPPGSGGGTASLSFVGRDVCATCHAGAANAFGSYSGEHIYANFKGSAHGQDMTSKGPSNRDVINGYGGSCQPCHTTGYDESGGFTSVAATPNLVGIGCEECHTRGSEHAGQPSSRNIRKWPVATESCWDCHTPEYKWLRNGEKDVDDATLRSMSPGSVSPHYRQLPVLLGYTGYKRPQIQGPHALVENTCVTCHLSEDSKSHHGSSALHVDLDACVACHGSEAAVEEELEEFEGEINEMLVELVGEDPSNPGEPDPSRGGGMLAAFAAANNISLTTNTNPDDPAVKAYKAARWNIVVVQGGPAVHNPPFSEQLLQDAKQLLK